MLVSTFELISMAASNSLAVFCFCNLIIAILLVVSSRTSSHSDEAKPSAFATTVNYDNFKKSIVSEANVLTETEEEKASSVSIDMVIDNDEETPDEEEEEDDDELRKRVEEFIEKINRGWRAEKLKTYTLGQ